MTTAPAAAAVVAGSTKAAARSPMDVLDEKLAAPGNDYLYCAKVRLRRSIEMLGGMCGAGDVVYDAGGSEQFGDLVTGVLPVRYEFSSWGKVDLSKDRLPLEDGSVDVVISWETIEHLWTIKPGGMIDWDGIRNLWAESWRVLKPGGRFFLTTTNARCPRTYRTFCRGYHAQIYFPSIARGEFLPGHIRELHGYELANIAKTTGKFVEHRLESHNCYSHMYDIPYESEEFAGWERRFYEALGREPLAHEKGDTLFFVSKKEGEGS